MDSSHLAHLSALEQAEKIKTEELKCIDVVNVHIDRIRQVNPKINAMVEERFIEARSQAREIDEMKNKSASDKPLLGVPFTIKEMIAVEGFRSTLGSIHRKENIQRRDATVVQRLKEAGAILLGTTNVPEVGFWFECANQVYGRTNNPYDLKRTPGGSTGGEAALLACGASAFGVGSDIGGSVRIPSFFCGIFGHKPSNGIVPFTGHPPLYYDNAKDFSGETMPLTTLGPLSRRASDLYTLMEIMLGDDGFNLEMKMNFKLQPRVRDWGHMKVFTLANPRVHATTTVEGDITHAVKQSGRYFSELGAEVIQMDRDLLLSAFRLWVAGVTAVKGRNFNNYLNPLGPIDFNKEFIKIALGVGNYTLPALLTAYFEVTSAEKAEVREDLVELRQLREHLSQLLGTNGILLLPPHPRKAPKHGAPLITPFDFCYTGIFNTLRMPATVAPTGLAKNGLPLGVQIVAAEDQDHLCLSAAEALESAFGGWVPPKI